MTVTNKFVQFGCWNQGLCGNESVPLTKIMHSLKTFTHKENPDFIVVAGDNYYPGKVKNKVTGEKIKTIVPTDLAAGFACLPKDVPIDMLLGNHDLETNMYISGRTDKETDCFITQEEIALAVPNHIDLVVHKKRLLGSEQHTLLLLIDTSMYDDDDVAVMLPCYKKMTGYEGITSKEELRSQQLHFIQEAVTAFQGENIILIGHHPITGYKLKKDKIKLIDAFPSFLAMLSNLFALKGDSVQYYYLCADLHLYQEGTVTLTVGERNMKIQQYIVGTGGTELDPDPKTGFQLNKVFKTQADVDGGVYTMTQPQQDNSVREFGFLIGDYTSAKLHFEFKKVPMDLKGGKKSRRTRKKSRRTRKKSRRTRKVKHRRYIRAKRFKALERYIYTL